MNKFILLCTLFNIVPLYGAFEKELLHYKLEKTLGKKAMHVIDSGYDYATSLLLLVLGCKKFYYPEHEFLVPNTHNGTRIDQNQIIRTIIDFVDIARYTHVLNEYGESAYASEETKAILEKSLHANNCEYLGIAHNIRLYNAPNRYDYVNQSSATCNTCMCPAH